MENVQLNELMSLFVDVISLPIIYIVFRNKGIPYYTIFIAALMFIVASHVFTIIEGFIFPDFFNILEHLSIFIVGLLYIIGLIKYFRKKTTEQ